MDTVLASLKANGAIDTRIENGKMIVEVGPHAVPTANTPTSDMQKVKEAIEAVDRLGESRVLLYCLEECDAEYDLVQ